MPRPSEPRLEVDILLMVEIGIPPCSILPICQFVFNDTHHIFHAKEIAVLKIADAATLIGHPIPIAAAIKQLAVDFFGQSVARFLEHTNNANGTMPLLGFLQYLVYHIRWVLIKAPQIPVAFGRDVP